MFDTIMPGYLAVGIFEQDGVAWKRFSISHPHRRQGAG